MTKNSSAATAAESQTVETEYLPPPPAQGQSAAKSPGKKRIIRDTREIYEEPLTHDEPDDEEVEIEADGELEIAPPPDPVQVLLSEVSDQNDTVIRVVRLPDPPNYRGKFRQAATEEMHVGTVSAAGHTRESLLDEIQHSYGGGRYRLEMRQRGVFLKKWAEVIADPVLNSSSGNTTAGASLPPPGGDLDSFLQQAQKFAEIGRAFGWTKQAPLPATLALPPEPPQSLTDQLQEFASVQGALKSLTGAEKAIEPRTGWLADLGFLVQSLGLKEILGPALQSAAAQSMLRARAAQPAGAPALPPSPQLPPQGDQPPQPAGPRSEQEALALILHVAVEDLTRNKRTGRAADVIEEMSVRHPPLVEFVNHFIALPPAEALQLLEQFSGRSDLAGLGHAPDWIAKLQEELGGDAADEVETANDSEVTGNV